MIEHGDVRFGNAIHHPEDILSMSNCQLCWPRLAALFKDILPGVEVQRPTAPWNYVSLEDAKRAAGEALI